jgi:thiol-disulfide isomerase/thioredoxin
MGPHKEKFDGDKMLNQLFVTAVSASIIASLAVNTTRAQGMEPKSYLVLPGVGIALNAKDGHLFAFKIVPKSPADESGLIKEGSRLVSVEVNGEIFSLDGKSVGDAASLIRGPFGTKIVLTLVPPNDDTASKVTLERKPLEIGVPDSMYKAFIGKPIPDFQLSALDGSAKKHLSDYRGKIIVLDFWASWCPTCYAPATKMQKISEDNPQWAGKVELMTVTVDSELSKAADVIKQQRWHRTRNLAVDADELKAIDVFVVPVIIIVAPDGTIATMAGAHALDTEKEIAALLAN